MNQPFSIEVLPYVLGAINILIPFAVLGLCVAVVRHPRTEIGYWSWHPVKRLFVPILLTPVGLLCIFIWPLVLLGWLLRPRCNCHSCQDDD
jgi:hypothetical protein